MQGCVLWEGTIRKDGYGCLTVGGVWKLAHRWAYEQEVGPIPEGLVIDHLCRTRACVNVLHMEPASIGENVLRGETLPAKNKAKSLCLRGHSLDDAYINRKGKRDCRTCTRDRQRAYYKQRTGG